MSKQISTGLNLGFLTKLNRSITMNYTATQKDVKQLLRTAKFKKAAKESRKFPQNAPICVMLDKFKEKNKTCGLTTDFSPIMAPLALVQIFALFKRVPENTHLKGIIVGAESEDFINKGKWFGAFNDLVEIICEGHKFNFTFDLTFIGPELRTTKNNRGNPTKKIKDRVKVTYSNCKLNDFLLDNPEEKYDFSVMFHPGFEINQEMFLDTSLMDLLSKRVEKGYAFFTSYCGEDFSRDKLVLENFGFKVEGPEYNIYSCQYESEFPFLLEMMGEDTLNHWGGYVGAISLN
jgi:hypothetical protein